MNKEGTIRKLKPIGFAGNKTKQFRKNVFQQNILLKALEHTTDLDELKEIAKFKSKAEVLRTMDKLSIRKEFHIAMAKNGLDLNTIVKGIKEILDKPGLDPKTKLATLQTLLKSLGLDKYDISEGSGAGWEDVLLKINDREKEEDKLKRLEKCKDDAYDVIVPEMPEEERKKKEENKKIEQSIYE